MRRIKTILIMSALLFPLWQPVFSDTAPQMEPYAFTSAADATRFNTLTNEVRCIVCQHQSIAESSTPIAAGLRQKIYQMVLAHKSDSEIKSYLVERYGEFILLSPRVSSKTLLLWLFPFIGLCIAGFFFLRLFKHKTDIP